MPDVLPVLFTNLIDFQHSNSNEDSDQFLDIAVTEANKIGEGMSSYVTYKIETKTNIGLFRKKSPSVHRRFSDFLGLHDKLTEKYLRSGRIVPPAPEKNVFGRYPSSRSAFDILPLRRKRMTRPGVKCSHRFGSE